MQELIESDLLVVVIILSIIFLTIGQKKSNGMTKKQKSHAVAYFNFYSIIIGLTNFRC